MQTSTLRDELTIALGSKSESYWDTLSQYLCGQLSRAEFDELIRDSVDTPELVQLHNALIISVLGSSSHHTPPTPPPDAPGGKGKSSRKRRRTLPYQGAGEDDDGTLLSSRLKRWTVGMGRRERERIKALQSMTEGLEKRRRQDTDEIAMERGVVLLPEGRDPPGTYLPLNLASLTRAPTLQHITERVALISSQHNLGPPSKSVSQLMMLAYEAKLKQLITQAMSLTSTSHAITSIQLSDNSATRRASAQPLSASSFDTLFTLRPAVLPTQSAAALRLSLGEPDIFDHDVQFKERHTDDERWQLLAMLAERSTVREALLAAI
ncbi:hypothetical protein BD410DRAFT_787080 [Rickenella mellea]|uniref:Transcriptional regulator of RNA polII, SAGA, subunit-domain-containing protein n=1 Tax=Rickenella mellea TaxID=50990 RepID=A0A4Y7QAF6_9AGAM|nr:hypothetical protein BD410DRAFT_787080 [Rickenella mellea]